MNTFKTILTQLKEIIAGVDKSSIKIRDKDVAQKLNIKPATLSSYKMMDIIRWEKYEATAAAGMW